MRHSEFHVNVCYNPQTVHNKLTLCVQWNSIFFQKGSTRCILKDSSFLMAILNIVSEVVRFNDSENCRSLTLILRMLDGT